MDRNQTIAAAASGAGNPVLYLLAKQRFRKLGKHQVRLLDREQEVDTECVRLRRR